MSQIYKCDGKGCTAETSEDPNLFSHPENWKKVRISLNNMNADTFHFCPSCLDKLNLSRFIPPNRPTPEDNLRDALYEVLEGIAQEYFENSGP